VDAPTVDCDKTAPVAAAKEVLYNMVSKFIRKTMEDHHSTDTRWKHRFQNFRRAFGLLREAVEDSNLEEYSDLEREGIIQRFEYTFELAWKTLKDYLEFSGVMLSEATPRKVIKECASSGIFAEAKIIPEVFMDMMLSRNALSHTYDFEQFKQIAAKVKELYLPELEKEYHFFIDREFQNA
jgi:nucleotidyltransferase substrate binding protein (TIGR01987 family)